MLAILAAAGCGGHGTGNVSGKVLFRGQPVTAGHVTFLGQDGRTASGKINADGSYTVAGAPGGPVTILVDSRPPAPILIGDPATHEIRPNPNPPPAGKYVPIPPRYGKADQSGLTYTVRKGAQVHDIVLEP